MAIAFWLVILVICVVAEVHTNAFIAIFIGFGAAIALILAFAGVAFALQAILWLIVSGVSLAALRPFAVRNFHRPLGTDLSRPAKSALTNLKGMVEVTVGDENHPGRVKIQGESWKAVTDWMEPIPVGSAIVVRKSYGTTLWVEPS
jgi:membrane protein implicated in regulation of membrane protease activity